MQKVSLNARFYAHRPTGMQRYCLELVDRLGSRLDIIRPPCSLRGSLGHLWEQAYLPLAVGKHLLWSPNNTGPVSVRRQVCTIHDVIPLDHPEWFTPKFVAWYRWLMPRLIRTVQHVITVSEFTKTRIMMRFSVDSEKVSVIPNGVDKSFTSVDSCHIERVRRALGLNGQPFVLCVSSLEPRKNLGQLLTAWRRLAEGLRKDYRLVISGAKGREAVFRELKFRDVPADVVFTGYIAQQDLPALYSGATAFVYPSLYEGFGLPPLEAMACGLPVITSNTTSIPEVTGNAAVFVDPNDADSIKDGLTRVLESESLRAELGRLGRKRAERFCWNATASKTLNILEREANR